MKATPLQKVIAGLPFGFVTSKDLPQIIAQDRLLQLLVRCGGCRFTCAAQDVEHLIRCVAAGGDYVRDVSVPSDMFRAAQAAVELEARSQSRSGARRVATFNPYDGDFGGAFDGFQVTSDADPGL